jgi:CBS domain-containing protein
MHVSQILRVKGDLVFTVRPHQTGREVAGLLLERQVGALVVLGDDDRVVGIVSERDIVRTIAQGGESALDRPVADCMTRDVLFARPQETVDSLLGRMTDRRIRHLPVCEGERLVGLVSIGDLVKWKIAETEEQAEELKAYIAQG